MWFYFYLVFFSLFLFWFWKGYEISCIVDDELEVDAEARVRVLEEELKWTADRVAQAVEKRSIEGERLA
jgi:hypothetical protein